MWFYIPTIIIVVLFALWFRRTHVYRHLRSGHGANPGQGGYAAGRWEGSAGPPGAGGSDGGGGGGLG